MKVTQKSTTSYARRQLATNPVWAVKALVRIFQENQTQQEQVAEATVEDNGRGFSGTDGTFASSLAKQYLSRGSLSDKQMTFVFKMMPKYVRQVINMSDKEKLEKLVLGAS